MKQYFVLVSNFMQSKYQQVCISRLDLYLGECVNVHSPSQPPKTLRDNKYWDAFYKQLFWLLIQLLSAS